MAIGQVLPALEACDKEGAAVEWAPSAEMLTLLMQNMQCDADTANEVLKELRETRGCERGQEESAGASPGTSKAGSSRDEVSLSSKGTHLQRRWTSMGPAADDLGARYSSLADDDTLSAKKREAAMMFAVAEGHLNDDDYEQAEKMAAQALALYKELGDPVAEADSARLVIHAYRSKADMAYWDSEGMSDNVADEAMVAGMKLAESELARFTQKGDVRGEAAMLLSMAEVELDRKSSALQKPVEAEESATRAWELFRKAKDAKMEALALQVVAHVRIRKRQYQEALSAVEEAVMLYKSIDEKRGQASALHLGAVAHYYCHQRDAAMEDARGALALVSDLGLKRQQAFEMTLIAYFLLEREKPSEALPIAAEALAIFGEIANTKGWATAAEQMVVDAHLAKEDTDKALEVAVASVDRVRDSGDKREEVFAQMTLAHANLAVQNFKDAMQAAERAQVCCKDLDDRSLEAKLLFTVCQVHCDKGDFEVARKMLEEAVAYFQEDGDVHHEAVTCTVLAGLLLMLGKTDDGLMAAEKGKELFEAEQETDQQGVAMLSAAHAHAMAGDTKQAIAVGKQALELAHAESNRRGEAIAMGSLAEFSRQSGDMEKAIQYAKEMRKIYQEARLFRDEAYALSTLTSLHLDSNEVRLAVKSAEAAYKVCQRVGFKSGQCEMLLFICEANLMLYLDATTKFNLDQKTAKVAREAPPKALKAAQTALSLAKRLGQEGLQASAMYWCAQSSLVNGRFEETRKTATEARLFYSQTGDLLGEAQAILVIARALEKMDGSRKEAETVANEALSIFKQFGDEQGEAQVKEVLQMIGADMRPMAMMNMDSMPALGAGAAGAPVAEQAGAASAVATTQKGLDPELVAATVQEMAKAAIGLDDAVYLDSALMDSGMDSLTAVSFRNGLQQNLGVKLPSSMIFDYPTMREVSDRIVELSLEDS